MSFNYIDPKTLKVGMLIVAVVPYEEVPAPKNTVMIFPSETHIGIIRGFKGFTDRNGNKHLHESNAIGLLPDDCIIRRIIIDKYLGNPKATDILPEWVRHICVNTNDLFKLIYF